MLNLVNIVSSSLEEIKEIIKENSLNESETKECFSKARKEVEKQDLPLVEYLSIINNINFKEKELFKSKSKSNVNKKSTDNPFENSSETYVERDENGLIKFYHFRINRQDKEPIIGMFTRNEMYHIHRMYTNYGSGLTQKQVSRSFDYSLEDFKRIIRAFSITKHNSPFPKHMLEEHTNEELKEIQLRQKENDLLNSLDKDEVKDLKSTVKKLLTEREESKQLANIAKEVLGEIDLNITKKVRSRKDVNTNGGTLFVWISDCHVGAFVSDRSIYNNHYDEEEFAARLKHIEKHVCMVPLRYSEIVIVNLGDSLDGMDRRTVSRTHELPQNMDNKDQFQVFIKNMAEFVINLNQIAPVSYYAVGESNHDGDAGYFANYALCTLLEGKGIEAKVSEGYFMNIERNNRLYICCHGKDSHSMFKNYPLVLDQKLENKINEYLDENEFYPNMHPNITLVKGDLHQSATTYGRRFKYKSVSSIFGSSEWIHKNFGNTPWGCDITFLDEDGTEYDFLVKE